MRIYLIRHGETDWNLEGKLQGREDIPLNDNGIQQAIICGQAFKGRKIKAILTSPLIRAKRTAEIIAEMSGIKKVIVEDGLIKMIFHIYIKNLKKLFLYINKTLDLCILIFKICLSLFILKLTYHTYSI